MLFCYFFIFDIYVSDYLKFKNISQNNYTNKDNFVNFLNYDKKIKIKAC